MSSASASAPSKDFVEFVKDIGEARSKQEEDRIVAREVALVRKNIGATEANPRKMKEYLIRMIYADMLGHDVEFSFIHAVNLCQQPGIIEKRVGYLMSSLCLHRNHELMILLINTMQKDLKSTSNLEVCAALNAVCKLVNEETVPVLQSLVTDLFTHHSEAVRKKAVMCLFAMHQIAPASTGQLMETFRRALCDKDPSVMAASLCALREIAKTEPHLLKDLVPSLLSIIKQVTDHRLHRDYDYHRIPAPWIQISILQLLARLGANDRAASENMYEVLADVMRRADTGTNAGYAVSYECVRTVLAIHHNNNLIENAAAVVSRFLKNAMRNLRYLGLKALALIVSFNPKFAQEHQMLVLDCLEDRDDSIRRKTLDLLYKMTNPVNVEIVTKKMIDHLRQAVDLGLRQTLVTRITEIAEQFAPNNSWYMATMNTVFELGGNLVKSSVAHNMLRLIAEGTGADDEEADNELRLHAVNAYLAMIRSEAHLNERLVEVIAWVLGEYGYLTNEASEEEIVRMLIKIADRPSSSDRSRSVITSAITKIVARLGVMPPFVNEHVQHYKMSHEVDLAQRCYELETLVLSFGSQLDNLLPMDASCEDIEVDPDLGFLDAFVENEVRAGKREWVPPAQRESFHVRSAAQHFVSQSGSGAGRLRFEAYEAPPTTQAMLPVTPSISTGMATGLDDMDAAAAAAAAARARTASVDRTSGIVLPGLQRRWGRKDAAATTSSAAHSATAEVTAVVQPTFGHAAAAAAAAAAPTAPAAPAAPQMSERDRQRQAEASLLFGASPSAAASTSTTPSSGMRAGAGRGVRRTAGASPAAAGSSAPAAAPAAAHAASSSSLIDFDMLSPSNTSTSSSAPISAAASLDSMFGSMTMSSPTAAPPAAAAGASMFGSMSMSSAPPAAGVSLTPSTGAGLLDDLMSFTPAPVAPSTGTASASNNVMDSDVLLPTTDSGLSVVTLPPALRSMVANDPRSHDSWQVLVDGAVFRVSYFKVYKAGELAVVMQFFNQGSTAAKNVSVQIEPPSSVKMSFVASDPVQVAGSRLNVSRVNARTSFTIALRVNMTAGFSAAVMGRIQFEDEGLGATNHGTFSLQFEIDDFVRPVQMSTNEYGGLWGQHTGESKQRVNATATNIKEAVAAVEKTLHVKLVQIIGVEAITAGRLLNGQNVLVHVKVAGPNSLDVTVRTKQKPTSDALLRRFV